ncbi:hypothetical protein D3C75_738150 [compost metagenome]
MVTFQYAGQCKYVADIVIDQQYLLAVEELFFIVQLLQDFTLVLRQIGFHTMQEQCGFIQQPLR